MQIVLRLSCVVSLLLAACGSGAGTRAASEEPAFFVSGAVTSISIDQQTFTVGDIVIAVDPQTSFEGSLGAPASLAELQVDDQTGSEAAKRTDGSLVAKVVHVFRPPAPPSPAANAQGPIEAVGAATITVAGIQFSVTDATVIRRNAAPVLFSDLKVGQSVVVKGGPDGGKLVARAIQVVLVPRPLPKLVSLIGPLGGVTSNSVTVLGQVLQADDASTLILRGDKIVPLSSLRLDETAQVTGKIVEGKGLSTVVIRVAN
jgi:hypothetical protein